MSKRNNKSAAILVALVLLLAFLGAGIYYSVVERAETLSQTAEQTAAPAPEEPIVEGEVPPQPETPTNTTVAETSTPEASAAPVGEQPAETAAPAVSTPSVYAMMSVRTIGDLNAPIKIVEYSSLTCSHCASFHKETLAALKQKFIDTGKVQMTFKEFPLNQPAMDASQILRCMPADKFVSFMNLLFEQQESWAYKEDYKDSLRQNARLAGMSDEQFDACLANTELKNRIAADMKAASDKYKIQSTPSFIINDGQKIIAGDQPLEFFEKSFDEVTSPSAPAPAQ